MSSTELLYRLALLFLPGIGPVLGRRLISYVGSVEKIFALKHSALSQIPGVGEQLARKIVSSKAIERAQKELRFIKDNDINVVFYLDEDYPKTLRQIDTAPLMLFVKGKCDFSSFERIISVVGTRSPSAYGKTICSSLIKDLVIYEPVIVSGLAYGIDSEAHSVALDNGLRTVAVLGHGLDMIYPASNRQLAEKIISNNGCLITEYPSYSRVDKTMFVRRNRIIAALSLATVIVESSIEGGAMITARYAANYGRIVAAFPGRITDTSFTGCNLLIKTKIAHLIENGEDLAQLLNWQKEVKQQKIQFSEISLTNEEKEVVDILRQFTKIHIDQLAIKLNKTVSAVLVIMFNLEMNGIIEQLPGNFYALKKV